MLKSLQRKSGLFAIAYHASKITFKKMTPILPFQKLMCPDVIKCLKSGRMEQFSLLFSQRISVRLVQVVSLEISLLSDT